MLGHNYFPTEYRYFTCFACILLALALGARDVRADWLNLTGAESAPNIAEITVLDDGVRVALELSLEDLGGLPESPEDWTRLAEEIFHVETGQGARLPVRLEVAEPRRRKDRISAFAGMINPTTGQTVPGPPEDTRVLYLELFYGFDERPASLTFLPPPDERGRARLTIGFIAYHLSVPIIDFRYLAAPARVSLDWADPWYSKFDHPNLKRHHKDPLMAFLYVEPREVRHEVLIRLRDLARWTDLDLDDQAAVASDRRGDILERAAAFFAARNPLSIDGKAREASAARAEFVNVSLNGVRVLEDDMPLDPATALIGVILSYPVESLPRQVDVRWQLFDEQIASLPATTIDPAGPFISSVEADNPIIQWRNYLQGDQEPVLTPIQLGADRIVRLPLLSIAVLACALGAGVLAVSPRWLSRRLWCAVALGGVLAAGLLIPVATIDVARPLAGPPDRAAADRIIGQLAGNLHGALRERDPARLRQALASSVSADHLQDLEPELRRGLAIEIQGGGLATVERIEGIEVTSVEPLEDGGFRAQAAWSADASAGHWGHRHRRRLRFGALVDLAPLDGAWKLTGLTVLSAQPDPAGPDPTR